ncbi:hypothetical protein E2C01_065460 [Portunus trituberculatus]|uniref:Uncharacterized protein n=1 Tax=Portunus trituberculatus TaxID=210409 RepID=A0A5B7HR56_PORTR|nr:hypothetical protein [Portunus trituberculatus]
MWVHTRCRVKDAEWVDSGGMPLSARRDGMGEDVMAPMAMRSAAFCSVSSLARVEDVAEP